MDPMRLIGRKSLSLSGSLILGIREMNDEVQDLSSLLYRSKCFTTTVMSPRRTSQYVLMNLNVSPSGPGDFSLPHGHFSVNFS